MDFLDELLSALTSGSVVAATAYATAAGINTSGSFLTSRDEQQLSDQDRRSILGSISLVDITLPAPAALAAPMGAAHQYAWCLWPSDYGGLGVDPETGAFRLGLLVEHCQAMPLASEQAALAAIQTPERTIACQAIGCCMLIEVHTDWQVCAGCRLAVFCQPCVEHADEHRGCRVCLYNSTPTRFPVDHMFERSKCFSQAKAALPPGNTDPAETERPAWDTTIHLLAAQAAYRIAGPSARRRLCRSNSATK